MAPCLSVHVYHMVRYLYYMGHGVYRTRDPKNGLLAQRKLARQLRMGSGGFQMRKRTNRAEE